MRIPAMSMDSIADFTLVVVRVRQDGFSQDLRVAFHVREEDKERSIDNPAPSYNVFANSL